MDRPEITTSTTSGTDPNRCVVHVKDTRQWAVDNDGIGRAEGARQRGWHPQAQHGEGPAPLRPEGGGVALVDALPAEIGRGLRLIGVPVTVAVGLRALPGGA